MTRDHTIKPAPTPSVDANPSLIEKMRDWARPVSSFPLLKVRPNEFKSSAITSWSPKRDKTTIFLEQMNTHHLTEDQELALGVQLSAISSVVCNDDTLLCALDPINLTRQFVGNPTGLKWDCYQGDVLQKLILASWLRFIGTPRPDERLLKRYITNESMAEYLHNYCYPLWLYTSRSGSSAERLGSLFEYLFWHSVEFRVKYMFDIITEHLSNAQ